MQILPFPQYTVSCLMDASLSKSEFDERFDVYQTWISAGGGILLRTPHISNPFSKAERREGKLQNLLTKNSKLSELSKLILLKRKRFFIKKLKNLKRRREYRIERQDLKREKALDQEQDKKNTEPRPWYAISILCRKLKLW